MSAPDYSREARLWPFKANQNYGEIDVSVKGPDVEHYRLRQSCIGFRAYLDQDCPFHRRVCGSDRCYRLEVPQLFAQQADLGPFHLETMCIDGEWEWWVLQMKKRVRLGRGKSASLGDAMLAAGQCAGGEPIWRDIGSEITYERKNLVGPARCPRRSESHKGSPTLEVVRHPGPDMKRGVMERIASLFR